MKINTGILDLNEEVGFQMAPMIDITFLLIIFFMVSANFSTAERIKIQVPVAESASLPKDPSGRINVTLTDDGTMFAGTQKVSEVELMEHIKAQAAERPNLKVFLRADARVKHGQVKKAMQSIAEGGITDVIFATYQSPN